MKVLTIILALMVITVPVHALTWDFEDAAQMDDWEVVNGDWTIEDGMLKGEIGTDYMGIAAGDIGWTDYTVEMEMSVSEGQYTYFMVRVQEDPLSYYAFERTQTGAMNAFRRDAGAHSKVAAGGVLPEGHEEFHIWKFVAEGGTMTAYIDDEEVLVVEDATYPAGRIGIGGYNSSILMKSVTVEGVNIPTTAIEPSGKLASSWGYLKAEH